MSMSLGKAVKQAEHNAQASESTYLVCVKHGVYKVIATSYYVHRFDGPIVHVAKYSHSDAPERAERFR